MLAMAIEDLLKELAVKEPEFLAELRKLMEAEMPEASGEIRRR